jgi:hypothetical protein
LLKFNIFKNFKLKKLKELDISRNEIKSISEKIGNLTELKKLWLNNLDIVNFPADKIKSLPNLASLYCFSSQNINIQNKTYFDLTKIKGNSLGKLKLNETHKEILKEVNDNIHELNINLEPKIFISYSHQDNHWLNRIQTHLRVLKNHLNLDFDLWDDERLTTGDDWEKEIKEAINEADIAILIISTDFLASDFITKKEIPPILENAEKKGVKIMPIVVEHCYFEISEISNFNLSNKGFSIILSPIWARQSLSVISPHENCSRQRLFIFVFTSSDSFNPSCKQSGGNVIAIGKIEDIFSKSGITHAIHTGTNKEGLELTLKAIKNELDLEKIKYPNQPNKENTEVPTLIFTNLVDTDMLYGHRNDCAVSKFKK